MRTFPVVVSTRYANNDQIEVRACRPAENPDDTLYAIAFAKTLDDVPAAEREARGRLEAYEKKMREPKPGGG